MNITREIASLQRMTVGELHQRYEEVFGEAVRSRHKVYLIRRIAWRLQANAEGGLSERALARAKELANLADVRVTPPRARASSSASNTVAGPAREPDPRLPPVGAMITRVYKGSRLQVIVLDDGFEYEGERFGSLSAVAKAITGSHMNGFRFFQIEGSS